MKEPTVSEIATEVMKAVGSSMSDEVKKLFLSASKYVGDIYYDNPNSIFDDKYDIKIQPLPQEFQMKQTLFDFKMDAKPLEINKKLSNNKEFFTTLDRLKEPLIDKDFNAMIEKLKEYAKNIDVYDKSKDNIRLFHDVNDMIIDIRKHVSTNGATLIVDDDPYNSYFGYRCRKTNTKWRISHTKVFDYLGDPDHNLDILDIFCLNHGEETRLNENNLNTFVKKILAAKNKYQGSYSSNVLDKIYQETFDGRIWEDASAMFADIIEHTKNNGSEICLDFATNENNDRFVCNITGRWWEISKSVYNLFNPTKVFNLPDINTHDLYHGHLIDYLNGKLVPTKVDMQQEIEPKTSINPFFLIMGTIVGGFLTSLNTTQTTRVENTFEEDDIIEDLEEQEKQMEE